ncbi:MAG TPA: hypothetical protein VFQ26_03170 [Nitrospiraceae bacterium]|nr:hypothetical protein [Nitrospiraceae bacterium]
MANDLQKPVATTERTRVLLISLGLAVCRSIALHSLWFSFSNNPMPIVATLVSGMTCDMGISAAQAARSALWTRHAYAR